MFDRSTFSIKTLKEATNNRKYWLKQKPIDRLNASWMLTCAAYNLDPNKIHRMDKTYFEMRKRTK